MLVLLPLGVLALVLVALRHPPGGVRLGGEREAAVYAVGVLAAAFAAMLLIATAFAFALSV